MNSKGGRLYVQFLNIHDHEDRDQFLSCINRACHPAVPPRGAFIIYLTMGQANFTGYRKSYMTPLRLIQELVL